MKCLHPLEVKNKATGKYIQVPCRKCPACLHNKQKEWAFRLMQERDYTSGNSFFVTLTFDDTLIPRADMAEQLDKKVFSDFVKRLRSSLQYHKVLDELRLFGCGEYGDLGRAHYHVCFFGIPLKQSAFLSYIQSAWPFGFVSLSYVSDARLMYVAKYTCKQLFINDDAFRDKKQLPFPYISTGRCRGTWLGYKMLNDDPKISRLKAEQKFFVSSSNGSLFNLPRSYKRALFTAKEREVYSDFLNNVQMSFYTSSYKQKLKKQSIYERQFESLFWKRIREERKIKLGLQQASILQEYEK